MNDRIVYMGTPTFACPPLAALAARSDVDLALVVTQPDRPAGRGRRLHAPPVKDLAESLGIPTWQPASLRTADARQPIVDVRPDLIVVAAYGLILGRSVLDVPPRGCVNLHASLLPSYRGAAPVSAAILNGDRETGVSLMRMERGLDTGPVYATSTTSVAPTDTTESLTGTLADVAARLLDDLLVALLDGSLSARPQPGGATLTRPLVKADGWIDWQRSAEEVERLVRAMWGWPRAWTTLPDGTGLQVHSATVERREDPAPPGLAVADRTGLWVRCGSDWLRVDRGQVAGGKPLNGPQLAATRQLTESALLGQGVPPSTPGPMVAAVGEEAGHLP